MNKLIFIFLIPLVLTGCATVVPNAVQGVAVVQDSEGGANGFQGFATINGYRYGLLTDSGRDHYNTLIGLYAVTFKNTYKFGIKKDDGIKSYKGLWAIDKQHLTYFAWLCQFSRDNVPVDSEASKAAEALDKALTPKTPAPGPVGSTQAPATSTKSSSTFQTLETDVIAAVNAITGKKASSVAKK